jgi:hypothetical protein
MNEEERFNTFSKSIFDDKWREYNKDEVKALENIKGRVHMLIYQKIN